jgi:hypothetical protein
MHDAEPGWYVRVTLPHGEQLFMSRFETEVRMKESQRTPPLGWKNIEAAGIFRAQNMPNIENMTLAQNMSAAQNMPVAFFPTAAIGAFLRSKQSKIDR